jgi:hypothetical protein
MMVRAARICVLVCLLCLGAAPAAFGCGLEADLEVDLEGMYPGSLSVAVALRSAADSGVVDAATLGEAPNTRAVHDADTVRRLNALRNALAASPAVAGLPLSFSLGYVESHLWTRYSESDGQVRVDIHTDGPAEGEPVVLTGEPVLMALLAGRLSVDRALADGLLVIDGTKIQKAAMRRVLESTSVVERISRR